ncbi:TRAF-like protein [Dunaliella salina]|uniref:TRAF-like protein n=1 Tax=Dunaliella salina TaxID=3046 RepID=A0ABQ7G6X3_DUNSA|nr:TRAF-like protein [Dunaliella salina]|eukprot:KAF5830352.1 TRAF-like protein [Dunaliella salina]
MQKSTYDVDLTLSPLSASGTVPGMVRKSGKRRYSGQQSKVRREKGGMRATRSSSTGSSTTSSEDEDEHQPHGIRQALEPWRYPLYAPSASFRMLDVVSGSHQFTLSGFSLARSMGCGTRICSEFFEVAGMMFRLETYPSGFTADTRRYISAFLTTPGAINPNHVLYEVAVLDQSGKDRHITASRACQNNRNGPLLAHCRGVVAAMPRLAKARELEKHPKRYLTDDMLVVRVTVQVLQGWSGPSMCHMATSGAANPAMEYAGPFASAPAARASQMHAFNSPGFHPPSSIPLSDPIYSSPLVAQSRPSMGLLRGTGEHAMYAGGLEGASIPHAPWTRTAAHIDPVPAASWHTFPVISGNHSTFAPRVPFAGLVPGGV